MVIGQLLVAIIGVGELFELYSNNFLMEEFWALVVIVFLFAFAVSEAIAALERRVEYYAASRCHQPTTARPSATACRFDDSGPDPELEV